MKILYLTLIETCAEAQNAYDVFFTDEINEDFIEKFNDVAKISYSKFGEKKYFRIIVKGKYTIKGFINNDNFRVLLADNLEVNFINELKEFINNLCKK